MGRWAKIHFKMRVLILLVAVVAVAANTSGVTLRTSSLVRRSEAKTLEAVLAAAPKGKAVAAPAPLLSKALQDKLQLALLFAVWYAFNAGCKLHHLLFFLFSPLNCKRAYLQAKTNIPFPLQSSPNRQCVQCIC